MEDQRILVSTEWRSRLENDAYKNWLKVGYGMYLTCIGIRPYIDREAKAFHGTLMAKGMAPCACVHVPRRRPNPHHDITVCDWAKELQRHHTKRKPTWNQSDGSKWTDPNVGYWEVAKLFMPFGCANGKVSAEETDATGLLNLLHQCDHFKINKPLVERLKSVRNMWAHAAQQELSQGETDDAFVTMKDLLQDPELLADLNANEAFENVKDSENNSLIDFEDIESKVISSLKSFISAMKDELSEKVDSLKDQEESHAIEMKKEISDLKDMIRFCLNAEKEEDDALSDLKSQIDQILERIPQPKTKYRLLGTVIWMIFTWLLTMYLKLPKLLSTRLMAIVMIYLLFCVTLMKENIDDFGCTKEELNDPLELKQFPFAENLNRAKADFVGREWLFKNLTNFLEKNHKESKGVHFIGAPGFGKSAFMSQLICSKLSSYSIHSQILGYHMCIHSHKNTRNPAKFVQNLAALISSRVPEYRGFILSRKSVVKVLKDDCGSDPTGCFNDGILSPLSKLQLRFVKPMYIVIDALDECFDDKKDLDKETTIVNILSESLQSFPSWLKVIVTSRNIPEIQRLLSLDMIELRPDDPRNLRDIERFIAMKARDSAIPDFPISTLVNKSQGNFLYIKLVLEHIVIEPKDFKIEKLSLPHSISSVYQNFFKRKYNTDESFRAPRRMFEILVAALSPLTADELYQVLLMENKDFDYEYDFMPILEDLSMYLGYSPESKGVVSVFHSSLTEWLVSKPNRGGRFYVDEKKGHRLLAEYYIRKIQDSSVKVTTQFLFHLAAYIVKGGRLKRHVDDFKALGQQIVNNVDSNTNATVLHLAAGSNSIEILSLILNYFENVDCTDRYNRTPVFYAVLFGRLDNIRLLHEREASLFHETQKTKIKSSKEANDCKRQMCGYSLLHVASQKGHAKIVQYLLENGVNISSLSGTGYKGIHLAAEFGQTETIKTLMNHEASLDNMCLYYAASRGHRHIVQFLLDHGIEDTCVECSQHFSLNKLSRSYMRFCNTALHAAAIHDFPDVLRALLDSNDTAINCTNYYGNEPLHEAVHHNNFRSLEVFLEHGANPSKSCKFTPAHSNSSYDSGFCLCGFTPLHIAAHHGFPAITPLLLQYNATYNATNCDGLQPIHVASCRGNTDILSILIKYGADINSKSVAGLTPIHYACKCRAIKGIQKLFELGADGLAVSSDNKTSWEFILEAAQVIITDSYFIDPYVVRPIDPVGYESNTRSQGLENMDDFLFPALTKLMEGFVQSSNMSSLASITHLITQTLVRNMNFTMWVERLVGNSEESNFVTVVPILPPFQFILDMSTTPLVQKYYLHHLGKKSVMPSLLKTTFQKVLINFDCSILMQNVKAISIYVADAYLDLGMDVNCEQSGLSPILVYLRQGGRNMAKVLVKHGVMIDIKCGEYFENSVFHLAAYHKLHYLQYLSVFQEPNQWEDYLQTKDALFDYLFDEYEKTTHEGQVRVTRVRDGPVTKAIKSHLRGYKIIDECLDDEGYTALHRAAQGGNVVAVRYFLNWGANVNVKSPEGFDLLTLCIWYAVKYRPRLNFHKPSLLTALEIDFASFTASAILEHLTKDNQLDIGCDPKREAPTLLHLAATRGMWRFIRDLFIAKDQLKVIGLDANCTTKHGITPMYLAKVHGGEDCEWDNPWCKVVCELLNRGASEILPARITEYVVIINTLFHGIPERFHHDLTLYSLLTLEEACGRDECLQVQFGSTQTTNLINEIKHGETENKICDRREDLLKDIACSIVSKQQELEFSTSSFLGFASASITSLKLLIRTLVSSKNDGKESCEPLRRYRDTTKSLSNLDMCSRETEISLNDLNGILKTKYKRYVADYEALEKEVDYVRTVVDSQDHESQRYKDLNKQSYLFTRNYLCKWQTVTFKYTQLRFLVHVLISWNNQVVINGNYPSISTFAARRIQEILLGENRKELVKFIIALSKGDLPKEYRALTMLQFKKPPLFDELFKRK